MTTKQIPPPDAATMQPKSPSPTLALGNDETAFDDLLKDIEDSGVVEQLAVQETSDGRSQWLPSDLDRFVDQINGIFREHVEAGMEQIGITVLNGIFQGNIKEASSRNPRKKDSYKRLCEHPQLTLDPRQLGATVRVAAFSLEMEQKGIFFKNLTFTHKLAIVRIHDEQLRISVALEADSQMYSVAETLERVHQISGKSDIGKAIVRAINSPQDTQRFHNILSSRQELAKLSKADRIKLRHETESKRQELLDHCGFLQTLETALFDIEVDERNQVSSAE